MTYTINQPVDVNEQVDIGDLNIHGHTISNSQNGTIVITTGSESHLDITYGAHISNLVLSGNDVGTKSSNANLTFTPHGSGIVKSNAAFQVGNFNLEDNTISSTNTDGDIVLQPNGNGKVTTDNLALDGNTISSTNTDGDIVLQPNGVGNIVLGNMTLNADQVIGVSEDNYVLRYDHASGTIGLEPEGGSSLWTENGSNIYYNSGNVGIGTTSPSTKLHMVNNNALTTDTFTIQTTGPNWADNQNLSMNSGITITNNNTLYSPSNPSGVDFRQYVGTDILKFNACSYNDFDESFVENVLSITAHAEWKTTYDGGYSMIFQTKETTYGGSLTEKMRIQSNGKVRIGPKLSSNYLSGSYLLNVAGSVAATAFTTSSDDRIKEQEEIVNSGLDVCKKLRPQVYLKKDTIDSTDTSLWKKETGFIAQEIYYDIPELRHLVSVDENVKPAENITTSNDPSIDPDYSSWGENEAGLNYIQIIPYTVSAIQEIDTRQTMDNERILELEGELSEAQETISTQAQDIATLKAQVVALMQHTGVTI